MGLNTKEAEPSAESVKAASKLLKTLANPNRLLIVCALVHGELSVGQMEQTLGIRQPTLSQQLAELREGGLVKTRRATKQVYYRLADERAIKIIGALEQIFCDASARAALRSVPVAPAPRSPDDELISSAARFAKVIPRGRRGLS